MVRSQVTLRCFVTVQLIWYEMSEGIIIYSELRSVEFEMVVLFCINPSNAELKPICHLLALLGAHHILRVSRIRVKQSCPNRTS